MGGKNILHRYMFVISVYAWDTLSYNTTESTYMFIKGDWDEHEGGKL